MVEMKYTKFVISAFKEKVFGKPEPKKEVMVKGKNVKLTIKKKPKKKKSDAIKWPKIRIKNISSVSGIIMPMVMIVIFFTVFGEISTALNTVALGAGSEMIMNMMNLIPLVLVGAAIIGIVTTAFRISY